MGKEKNKNMIKEAELGLSKSESVRRYPLSIFEFIYQTLGKFYQKCYAVSLVKLSFLKKGL